MLVYQRVVNLGPTVKVVALCESIGARSKRGGAATQRDVFFLGGDGMVPDKSKNEPCMTNLQLRIIFSSLWQIGP